jgi:hypothetical protein
MDELMTSIVGIGLLLVTITFAASYAIGYYNANSRWILRASSFDKTLFTRGEMYYVVSHSQHCQEKEWLRNEVWRAATGKPLIPDKMPLLRMANEEGIDITKMDEKEREELYRVFLRQFQMTLEHRAHDAEEHYGP